MTFERHKGSEGVSYADIWGVGRSVSGKGNSICKGPAPERPGRPELSKQQGEWSNEVREIAGIQII